MYYNRGGNFSPAVPQGFDAFSRWFDWAMKRFAEKWQVWLIQGLIVTALMTVSMIGFFIYFFSVIMRSGGFGGSAAPPVTPNFGPIFAVEAVAILVSGLFYSFLMPGMLNTAMKQAHGEEITVSDLFSGGQMMLPVVGASLVVMIPYIIGIYLCFIPGLIWISFTWLTIPLVVTRRMGVFEAVSASMAIARQNFWLIALYGLVTSMLSGMLPFLSLPALSLLQVSTVADLYGITNPDQVTQPLSGSIPPPPMSYGPPPAPPQEPPSPPPGF